MKEADLNALLKRAASHHNAKSFEHRLDSSITSVATQIHTILSMKQSIMRSARQQCAEADAWIDNLASDMKKELDRISHEQRPYSSS